MRFTIRNINESWNDYLSTSWKGMGASIKAMLSDVKQDWKEHILCCYSEKLMITFGLDRETSLDNICDRKIFSLYVHCQVHLQNCCMRICYKKLYITTVISRMNMVLAVLMVIPSEQATAQCLVT